MPVEKFSIKVLYLGTFFFAAFDRWYFSDNTMDRHALVWSRDFPNSISSALHLWVAIANTTWAQQVTMILLHSPAAVTLTCLYLLLPPYSVITRDGMVTRSPVQSYCSPVQKSNVSYLDLIGITMFKALYRWTSFKGGAHTHFAILTYLGSAYEPRP